MVDVTGGPPVDYRSYHTHCRYNASAWLLPKGTDSVATAAGLQQLNSQLVAFDTQLLNVETLGAVFAPTCYTGVWHANTTQSLASSSVVANPTFSYVNDFALSGTPSIGSFTIATGIFSIATAGYWRITYNVHVTGASAVTEGYMSVFLKDSAAAAYPVRTLRTMPLETRGGETSVYKSVLYRCGTTGNIDLDTTKTYVLGVVQENNFGTALTIGGANTWISIEYVRPL